MNVLMYILKSATINEKQLVRKNIGVAFGSLTQDVIELHPVFIEHTDSDKSSQDSITLKEPSGILVLKS